MGSHSSAGEADFGATTPHDMRGRGDAGVQGRLIAFAAEAAR